MKITEKHLRQIIRQEVKHLTEAVHGDYGHTGKKPSPNAHLIKILDEFGFDITPDFLDYIIDLMSYGAGGTPARLKAEVEAEYHYDEPADVYADIISAVRRDERAQDRYDRSSYRRGDID